MLPASLGAPDPATGPNHELIATLRKEAEEVKDCFTRFSFQSLAIATAVLGFVCAHLHEGVAVAFASIPIVVMMCVVARIGTYKYGTANRNFGFELFLERSFTAATPASAVKGVSAEMSWEEAMLVWRIVQATIARTVYRHKGPRKYGARIRVWSLMPAEQVKGVGHGAIYDAGSYIRTMVRMLLILTLASILPLFVSPLLIGAARGNSAIDWSKPSNYIPVGIGIITTLGTIIYHRLVFRRCAMLEGGMLSIHGCAVMWDIVFLAHSRAKRESEDAVQYITRVCNLSVEIKKWIEEEAARGSGVVESDLVKGVAEHLKSVDVSNDLPSC